MKGVALLWDFVWLQRMKIKSLRWQNVWNSYLYPENVATNPPFEPPMQRRGKEAANASQFFSKNLSFHPCLALWWTNELFPLSIQRAGLGSRSGIRVALAGKQIIGLGRYHGFWNTRLWASHVLAQGAGPSDVVGGMWKLSWVYPAQPSLVPAGRESRHQDTETCIQTDKPSVSSALWYHVYILGS